MSFNYYKKNKLKDLIDSFIYNTLDETEYEVIDMPAYKLLTWNRLDLGFKLFFLDMFEKNAELAIQVYKHDIRSQTLDKFNEYGNGYKNSFSKYIETFKDIHLEIEKKGFNQSKSLIPLSEYNSIINGAHRVASSIKLNRSLMCVNLKHAEMICDYQFYYKRNVPLNILDMAVNKFIEYSDSCFIAFLWPSGKRDRKRSEEMFTNVVYKKEIKLSPKGAYNLIVELYKHMDWIGNPANGFHGAGDKLSECFPSLDSVVVIVFQADSLKIVNDLKNSVRNIHNIGFSSIHITDTKEEAIRMSRLIFNDNGIHYLNNAEPFKYFPYDKVSIFSSYLEKNRISPEDILIDGSAVLSLYGLRKCQDIDFLIIDNDRLKEHRSGFEVHDSELVFHNREKKDLIYNPFFYLYYSGLKFVSFTQLYNMKSRRSEEKDKIDCKLMDVFIADSDDKFGKTVAEMKQSFFYFKVKLTRKVKDFVTVPLKIAGLYSPVKKFYRALKARKR